MQLSVGIRGGITAINGQQQHHPMATHGLLWWWMMMHSLNLTSKLLLFSVSATSEDVTTESHREHEGGQDNQVT